MPISKDSLVTGFAWLPFNVLCSTIYIKKNFLYASPHRNLQSYFEWHYQHSYLCS